jgi:hypothetical protein
MISSADNLRVSIQSLGYKSRVPKNIQVYLKADINNEGGGEIVSIYWEQIEPPITSD